MSILSSSKVGKYSIPVNRDSLLKDNFEEIKKDKTIDDILQSYSWSFFTASGTAMGTFEGDISYFRHKLYPVLTVCLKEKSSGETECTANVSSIFDLFDSGIWDTNEVQNVMMQFAEDYAAILGDMTNDDFKNKNIESIGQLMDFIKDNKPYFMKVKKLHRNILLAQGKI